MKNSNMKVAEIIRGLRTKYGMSRKNLAELIGISVSHLNKIEAGNRRAGIDTLEKILEEFDADLIVRTAPETVKAKCLYKMQEIIENASDSKAIFLTDTMSYIAEHYDKSIS